MKLSQGIIREVSGTGLRDIMAVSTISELKKKLK
jgi:hypothetical protein